MLEMGISTLGREGETEIKSRFQGMLKIYIEQEYTQVQNGIFLKLILNNPLVKFTAKIKEVISDTKYYISTN
jgi:hypothetical protein